MSGAVEPLAGTLMINYIYYRLTSKVSNTRSPGKIFGALIITNSLIFRKATLLVSYPLRQM